MNNVSTVIFDTIDRDELVKFRQFECPIAKFGSLVYGKYKLRILWELIDGAKRNSEIHRALKNAWQCDIPAKTLSRELKDLQAKGLIYRNDYQQVPPKVDYGLTPFGVGIIPVMNAICDWDKGLS